MPNNSGKMTTGPDQPNLQGVPNLPENGDSGEGLVEVNPETLSHTVRVSETLAQIALMHGVELEKLTAANKLTGQSVIYPGLRLLIPRDDQPSSTVQEQLEAHVVLPGESLFSIGQKYGLTVSKLQQFNSLADNAVLFPGTTLNLVEREVETEIEAPLKLLRSAPTTCLVHGYHRVKFGDQLSRIASLHGVSTQSLLSANNLGWNALIHEGQKLLVPISHNTYDCPNLVRLEPAALHTARTYFDLAKERRLSDYTVVIALCLEMQRSGLTPDFGALSAGNDLLLDLVKVEGIETLNIKQVISIIGFENLADGSALWEPSAWAWIEEVR
jgi:LysM repeat protein